MMGAPVVRAVRQVRCTRCSKRVIAHGFASGSGAGGGGSFSNNHHWAIHSSTRWMSTTRELRTAPSGSFLSTSSTRSMKRRLSAQLSSKTLRRIRSVLQRPPTWSPSDCPEHTVPYTRKPSEAAVLIPLMNIHGRPCVLLEKRSEELRVHAGEVSFPGGKADPTDLSLAAAALREAHEELGLPPDHVEILGMLNPPEYSLGNKARVWAFVGFVHDHPFNPVEAAIESIRYEDDPIASLHLGRLDPSPSEVSALIPVPLSILVDGPRRSLHFFRMDPCKPYWKYTVGDLILPTQEDRSKFGLESRSHDSMGETPSPQAGDAGDAETLPPWKKTGKDIELWGLSGWFLHRLMAKMNWTMNPTMEPEEG